MDTHHKLKSLGESAHANGHGYSFANIDASLLEAFDRPSMPVHALGHVRITAPEFTSLCPITGQPDFATIHVAYSPNLRCVESKAFKLYLASFRNVGAFHESVASRIAQDLILLLEPVWLYVFAEFTPRGGIAFHPRIEYGPVPLHVKGGM